MKNYTNLIPQQATLVFCKDTWSFVAASDKKLKVFLEHQYENEDVYGLLDFNPHTEGIDFHKLICCSLKDFETWYDDTLHFAHLDDDEEYEIFGDTFEGWSVRFLWEAVFELIDKAREHLGHRSHKRAMYDMAKTIGRGKWIFTDIEDEQVVEIGDDEALTKWLEDWNVELDECYTSAQDFNEGEDYYRLHRQECVV